tara:strand:- start:237 stop:539 length:303 start_codon:yes stop_codon:yes gene_type:complete
MANRMKSYNAKNMYSDIEKQYIKKNSPIITHQLIIPLDEFSRLRRNFNQIDTKINPDLIIFDNKNKYFNFDRFSNQDYCEIYNSKRYNIIILKEFNLICN